MHICGSRIFRTGGRCLGAVEISGSGDRFDAPSHLSYVFVVRVENTIHIEDVMTVKTFKTFTRTPPPLYAM